MPFYLFIANRISIKYIFITQLHKMFKNGRKQHLKYKDTEPTRKKLSFNHDLDIDINISNPEKKRYKKDMKNSCYLHDKPNTRIKQFVQLIKKEEFKKRFVFFKQKQDRYEKNKITIQLSMLNQLKNQERIIAVNKSIDLMEKKFHFSRNKNLPQKTSALNLRQQSQQSIYIKRVPFKGLTISYDGEKSTISRPQSRYSTILSQSNSKKRRYSYTKPFITLNNQIYLNKQDKKFQQTRKLLLKLQKIIDQEDKILDCC